MYRWVVSVCVHSTQLSILIKWWNRGSFLAVSANLSSALEYQVLNISYVACFCQGLAYVCTELAAPVAAWAGRGLEAFRTFHKQQQKVLPSMTRAYQCLRSNPVTLAASEKPDLNPYCQNLECPSSGRLPSLPPTGMFVFCGITLLLLRTDQILSARNYFVGSALSEIAFQRADMRERFASIDLAQCRIACKTLKSMYCNYHAFSSFAT